MESECADLVKAYFFQLCRIVSSDAQADDRALRCKAILAVFITLCFSSILSHKWWLDVIIFFYCVLIVITKEWVLDCHRFDPIFNMGKHDIAFEVLYKEIVTAYLNTSPEVTHLTDANFEPNHAFDRDLCAGVLDRHYPF